MRILAVDHGSKHLGLALSDPTGTIANPLQVITHVSREVDIDKVTALTIEHEVDLIVVGQSSDEDGQPNLAGRQAGNFAKALQLRCGLPVELWDESFSTSEAREARIQMGVTRNKRSGHLDELAATLILQSYLDVQAGPGH